MSVIGNTRLSFSEEQAMLLDVAREFCRDKSPISAVRALLDTETGYDPAVWDEMAGLGWAGVALPEACGGAGLGVAALVPVLEAMGRSLLVTPLINTALAAQLVLRAGGLDRFESLLAEIAGGLVATPALLEGEDWGSQAIACQVDENLQLSGIKHHVGDATQASVFVVLVQYGDQPALALVRAEQLAAGAIEPHTLIDETRRAAAVNFAGVKLAQEALITGPLVTAALRDVQLVGALLLAAEATGSAAACLDTTVEYLKTRKQFGRLIGSYQALKHPAVELLTAVDASRSFIYHAASLIGDKSLDRDAEIACRMAKAQAGDTLLNASDRSVQFHGGMGFTYECDAQLYLRRAQWLQAQYGDSRHHRKRLAGLLLDPQPPEEAA